MSYDAEREIAHNTPCPDCHLLGCEHLPECPNAVEPDEPVAHAAPELL